MINKLKTLSLLAIEKKVNIKDVLAIDRSGDFLLLDDPPSDSPAPKHQKLVASA